MKSLLLLLQKIERWFLSSNAKDIGVLYLMFALFSGLIGTAYLVLIHLELVVTSLEYISDNQLYCLVPVLLEAPKDKLNPWFITGFVDAEGAFIINVIEKTDTKLKWGVRASFKISLHPRDRAILEQIKLTLGVGNIYTSPSLVHYEVNSLKDLNIVIDHFNNYPLITQKNIDFLLFKIAIAILNKKEHLTEEGLLNILSIKASMNWGLSDKLVTNFPQER
jgi:hypothetical protein